MSLRHGLRGRLLDRVAGRGVADEEVAEKGRKEVASEEVAEENAEKGVDEDDAGQGAADNGHL